MSVSVPAALVAAVLASAPVDAPSRDFAAAGLDAVAVERGLRARIGDELDAWSITIDSSGAQHYTIDCRGPDGAHETREVELAGRTNEDRSRELASTLALVIEEASRDTGAEPDGPKLDLPTGFLVAEGHLGLGPPRNQDPDFGLGLAGGVWLLGEHLQPRAGVRWSHSRAGDLTVHQVSGRLGLAAGAPIGRFWVGGLVMPAFKWTRAHQVRSASAWAGGGELSVLGQYRRDWLVVGVRTGVETTFLAPRAAGTRDVIRWGHLRWLLVVEVGLGF